MAQLYEEAVADDEAVEVTASDDKNSLDGEKVKMLLGRDKWSFDGKQAPPETETPAVKTNVFSEFIKTGSRPLATEQFQTLPADGETEEDSVDGRDLVNCPASYPPLPPPLPPPPTPPPSPLPPCTVPVRMPDNEGGKNDILREMKVRLSSPTEKARKPEDMAKSRTKRLKTLLTVLATSPDATDWMWKNTLGACQDGALLAQVRAGFAKASKDYHLAESLVEQMPWMAKEGETILDEFEARINRLVQLKFEWRQLEHAVRAAEHHHRRFHHGITSDVAFKVVEQELTKSLPEKMAAKLQGVVDQKYDERPLVDDQVLLGLWDFEQRRLRSPVLNDWLQNDEELEQVLTLWEDDEPEVFELIKLIDNKASGKRVRDLEMKSFQKYVGLMKETDEDELLPFYERMFRAYSSLQDRARKNDWQNEDDDAQEKLDNVYRFTREVANLDRFVKMHGSRLGNELFRAKGALAEYRRALKNWRAQMARSLLPEDGAFANNVGRFVHHIIEPADLNDLSAQTNRLSKDMETTNRLMGQVMKAATNLDHAEYARAKGQLLALAASASKDLHRLQKQTKSCFFSFRPKSVTLSAVTSLL